MVHKGFINYPAWLILTAAQHLQCVFKYLATHTVNIFFFNYLKEIPNIDISPQNAKPLSFDLYLEGRV